MAASTGEEGAILADFAVNSDRKGFCSRGLLLDLLQRRGLSTLGLPAGDGDGKVSRDAFMSWLFGATPGSGACLARALRARAAHLLADIPKQPASDDSASRLAAAWPGGHEPREAPKQDGEEAVWQQCLVAIGATPPPQVLAAKHLRRVVDAGLDANKVAFPHVAFRSGHAEPLPALTPWSDLVKRCMDEVAFPPLGHIAGTRHSTHEPLNEAEPEALQAWLGGLVRKPAELRSAIHRNRIELDMVLTSWPIAPMGVLEDSSEGTASKFPRHLEGWRFEFERLQEDPSFLEEGRYLRGSVHHHPTSLDMELKRWPEVELDVIKQDKCTSAQEELLQRRSRRGAPSEAQMQRRRAKLAKYFEKEGGDPVKVNMLCFEDLRPSLGRQAALAAMHARWANDAALSAQLQEQLAEEGAKFAAWPAPCSRAWPAPDAKWARFCKWFAMWRRSRQEKQRAAAALNRKLPALKMPILKRVVSTSSEASWEVVSECSDSSWQDVEGVDDTSVASMSPEAQTEWVESKVQEIAALEADCERELARLRPALQAAKLSLNCLAKADVVEMKAMKKPPPRVVLVLEALCVCFRMRPVGGDYKKHMKNILQRPDLLNMMCSYDKDSISSDVLKKLTPYMNNPDFKPEVVKQASVAAQGMCQWIRAIYCYGQTVQQLAPKKVRACALTAAIKKYQSVRDESEEPAKEKKTLDPEELAQKIATAEELAADAVRGLNKRMIAELKGFGKPPQECMIVGVACAHLLQNTVQVAGWKGAQQMMADMRCIESMRSFDVKAVSKAPFERVETLVTMPWFSFDGLKGKSLASAYMAEWVVQNVAKRRLVKMLQRVQGGAPSEKRTTEAVDDTSVAPMTPEAQATLPVDLKDLVELRCLSKPPASLGAVLEAVTHLLTGIDERIQVDGEGSPTDVSWGVGKKLLGDPKLTLEKLRAFPGLMDSGLVPEANFTRALRVRDALGERFTPEHISKSSAAAKGLCAWVCDVLRRQDLAMGSSVGIVEPQVSLAPEEGKIVADNGFTIITPCDTCSTDAGSMQMSPVATSVSTMSTPVSPSRHFSPEAWARKQELETVLSSSVQLQDVQEIKSFGRPPKEIKLVLDAVAPLLSGPDANSGMTILANPRAFIARLSAFEVSVEEGHVSAANIALATELSNKFNLDQVAKSSKAAMGLCQWVHAAIAYHELVMSNPV